MNKFTVANFKMKIKQIMAKPVKPVTGGCGCHQPSPRYPLGIACKLHYNRNSGLLYPTLKTDKRLRRGLILALCLFVGSPVFAGQGVRDGAVYDTDGTKGTVIAFHGAGHTGVSWWQDGQKLAFVRALRKDGYSYICPQARSSNVWEHVDLSPSNADLVSVTNLIRSLGARPPFFFVGHSAGGWFSAWFALNSQYEPLVIQYSNHPGDDYRQGFPLFSKSAYKAWSIFCYSSKDPEILRIDPKLITESIRFLQKRRIPVASRDLHATYLSLRLKYEHSFLNTASFTIPIFNQARGSR